MGQGGRGRNETGSIQRKTKPEAELQSAPSALTMKLQPQTGQPTCSLAPMGSRPLAMRASRSSRADFSS
jgi:hypothetical protein